MEWLQIFFKEQKNREYVTLGFVTTNEQHSQHLTTWHNYMLSCSWRKTNALSPTTSRVERRAISCSSYYLLWFLLIHLRSFASFSPILISHAKPTSASQLFSLIFLFWSLLSTPVKKKKRVSNSRRFCILSRRRQSPSWSHRVEASTGKYKVQFVSSSLYFCFVCVVRFCIDWFWWVDNRTCWLIFQCFRFACLNAILCGLLVSGDWIRNSKTQWGKSLLVLSVVVESEFSLGSKAAGNWIRGIVWILAENPLRKIKAFSMFVRWFLIWAVHLAVVWN